MKHIFVSGLINIETTLKIDGFPVPYFPVRYLFHDIQTRVSGVGYNVARALTVLGNQVHLASFTGTDTLGNHAMQKVAETCGSQDGLSRTLQSTPQSVILYDSKGNRQIHVDLKDIQQQSYPLDKAMSMMGKASLTVLCNINFSRPFLSMAQEMNIPIATDVHALSSLEDDYNRDFMRAAKILFLSDEKLPLPPQECILKIASLFDNEIIVIGMHDKGALLYCRDENQVYQVPAYNDLLVINTIGAGDALFSSFLHFYIKGEHPSQALQKACLFAAHKIGAKNASEGFLNEKELNKRFEGQDRYVE